MLEAELASVEAMAFGLGLFGRGDVGREGASCVSGGVDIVALGKSAYF